MILTDSNVFLIDRFFHRDARYTENRRFVERLPGLEAAISVYGLLEVCGLASFNLSARELTEWFFHFDRVYGVTVLFPRDLPRQTAQQFWEHLLDEMYRLMSWKMTFLDAAILALAEEHQVSRLITWNVKDFTGRTSVPVMTPQEFMEEDS